MQKVIEKRRLTPDEGLELLKTPRHESLFTLADFARKQIAGDFVTYTSTLHLYPTNICELGCPFCCYHAKPGSSKGYLHSTEALEKKVVEALPLGISEVHIVGGLYRKCNLPYYLELLKKIRKLDPNIHIKALTATEIAFLAQIHTMTHHDVLSLLIKAGLDFLPGGGAEIFDTTVRAIIAPNKCSSETFIEIHKTAHLLGLASNITMLFNHIENEEHIINHLERVRSLQDETGKILAFVPLLYISQSNTLLSRPLRKKDPKTIFAVARLMLDNVKHIKVLWNYLGINLAKELLLCGGDDFGSTSTKEQVAVAAGGTQQTMSQSEIDITIRQLGRTPRLCYPGGAL